MKLQVAIDRVPLADAVALAQQLDGKVAIIEMGTSLVKDEGLAGFRAMRAAIRTSQLLIDLKTIDEGGYEFKQGFAAGADILTVMGAASLATLKTTAAATDAAKKEMMIDLMEVDAAKQQAISIFPNAIYALHHSTDRQDHLDPTATVADFHAAFPQLKRLAIAGGIDLAGATALAAQGLTEIAIVGSAITKAADPVATAQQFMEAIKA
ncbi:MULTISPECIES: orotidine 5'-phosphate decarboxylase / HUMPS family protein [Lacticaseibacillus]|uniref:3-hexulose-6-phosphate synthase n=2 Tax=Lacticaseibacillus TaxID=2759736 RepID=A0AAN1F153_LACCA|nr:MULTISPECIES: orotidine 5'-phosphate decarboxylase / HUMPS family protein [Lacticaseibacillus]ARY92817.1 3-hexulose-6-phosphate synthase [Lacticaseibacillus casei]KAB1970157.1 3-hexulose-6-phosphate synthase [Lacticaseibacillus casei]WLV80720.1 orotidine 5'-phosphate decarboxylase [Lacticaseibacillus sp. NCIMB 15473]WNX24680.1 orotidine 5'-phosphate decarboxylase / HUMPS family protein [Lacticaseibacillus casei]WNX27452.1 orotidine 5'-phosphate decarboxylase / HUMPS family protein [Lacticas